MKVQRKQGLVSGSDGSNKHSPSNKRSLVPSPVAHRPLRDRIIHLLALKPYRKPELLLWLERERASPKDKADLTSVLDEVRHLARRPLMAPRAQDATSEKKISRKEDLPSGTDINLAVFFGSAAIRSSSDAAKLKLVSNLLFFLLML